MSKNKKSTSKSSVSKPAEVSKQKVEENGITIVKEITEILKAKGLGNFIFTVADKSGKIISYVAATSVGDLLTLEYSTKKDVERIISNKK
jgi:hypothetical protein